jgi:hypothetical protein
MNKCMVACFLCGVSVGLLIAIILLLVKALV